MNSTYYSLYWSIPQRPCAASFFDGMKIDVRDPRFCRGDHPSHTTPLQHCLLTADRQLTWNFDAASMHSLRQVDVTQKQDLALSSMRSHHLLTKEFNRNDGQD